jgi:hypothetical protein
MIGFFALALLSCGLDSATPAVGQLSPQLVCEGAEEPSLITVSGEGFAAAITGALSESPELLVPQIRLRWASALDGGEGDGLSREITLSAERGALTWIEGGFTFEVSPELGLSEGLYDVIAVNPDGAGATLEGALAVIGEPTLTELSPESFCQQLDGVSVTIAGEGLLVLDGQGPALTVGDLEIAAEPVECEPLAGAIEGELCRALTAQIDGSALPLGEVEVSVLNPAPADCAPSRPASFWLERPPSVASASPELTCDSGVLEIRGEGFVEGMAVAVGGVTADAVTLVDGQTLEATLAVGTPTGWQDVVVTAPDGCEGALEQAVEIAEDAEVYYVDPPAIYAGLSFEVTAYVADLSTPVSEVWLERGGDRLALAFSWSEDDPGEVTATVPAGLEPGEYTLGLAEEAGCEGALEGALTISGDDAVALTAVEPPQAWTYDNTAALLLAADPPPEGQVGFEDTPRVFLSLRGGGETTALVGVGFQSPAQLTAVIPHSLPVGTYDVLVINPAGEVGLLSGGLTITEQAPPVITSVSPASLSSSHDEAVTLYGHDFDDPEVGLECEGGSAAGEVTGWDSTSVEALLPSSAFSQEVCVVTLVNADGTSTRWAAVSVRNPAQNLFGWSDGGELVEARRAPAAAAGRTTGVTRYVYAIGGDGGDEGAPLSSVERASVGVYGEVGEWSLLPGGLPEGRTLAQAARVGRFIYLVGGRDSAGPLSSVRRALILDPLEAPLVEGLSIDGAGGGGLGAGDWRWRVAALYDTSYAANPGGEGLAGEPLTATLPERDGGLAVTLSWSAVEGASGYRVYRSPEAGAASGEERWIADVEGTALTDDGLAADEATAPLPAGALGAWAEMPSMTSARQSPCLAVAPDPPPDPERVFLYAAGGLDDSGRALDSVERLDITVVTADAHTPGSWELADQALSEARHRCAGYAVDSELHSVVEPGESWVYFAGGLDDSGRATGEVDAGRVDGDGELVSWQEIRSLSPARAGFGAASASDYLYALGGQGGEPSSGGVSAELEAGDMPDVQNWNNLGGDTLEPRYLPGSAQESAVIFLIGGETHSEDATRSVEVTNY